MAKKSSPTAIPLEDILAEAGPTIGEMTKAQASRPAPVIEHNPNEAYPVAVPGNEPTPDIPGVPPLPPTDPAIQPPMQGDPNAHFSDAIAVDGPAHSPRPTYSGQMNELAQSGKSYADHINEMAGKKQTIVTQPLDPVDEPTVTIPAEVADVDRIAGAMGFVMEDVPDDADTELARPPVLAPADPEPVPAPRPAAAVPILDPGRVVYESRLRVLEAWRYVPGDLRNAPAWVDRNWLIFAGHDPLREMEPGPALRVPLTNDPEGLAAIARPGDYLTKIEAKRDDGTDGTVRMEVWNKQEFEKLWLPKTIVGEVIDG